MPAVICAFPEPGAHSVMAVPECTGVCMFSARVARFCVYSFVQFRFGGVLLEDSSSLRCSGRVRLVPKEKRRSAMGPPVFAIIQVLI